MLEVNGNLFSYKIFLHGIRFDLSVIFLFLTPFLILSFIQPLNKKTYYTLIWKYGPIFPFFLCFVLLVSDLIYFQNAQKHLGYEAFIILGKDSFVLLESVIVGHPFLILGGIVVLGLFLYGVVFVLQKFSTGYEKLTRTQIVLSFLWVLVAIVSIRGGFQKSFISPSNAIISGIPLVNQLVLNGVFTIIQELGTERFSRIQEMKIPESVALAREVLQYEGSTYVNDLYPIYRRVNYPITKPKKNILVVILESWPTKYVLGEFRGIEITPNFNRLVEEGEYFPKFFANGGRTSNGLVSILSGFPDRPGKSMVHSKYSLNRFTPIADLLAKKEYRTTFYYGGELAFENLAPVIKNWGFEKIYDASTLGISNSKKKTVWGYFDEDLFSRVLNDIRNDKESSPSLKICLTLSTHHPFEIPDREFEIFSPDEEENRFINSLHYADHSLGKFFEELKKLAYYKNTTIFLVSDHTSHRTLNYFEDRNIPFLVLNHEKKNYKNNRVSSQIDILPTILGMVGGEFYFSGFGRDIYHDKREGYAYIAFGNIYGWAEKNTLFMDTVEEFNGLHFTISEPYESRGPCKNNMPACLESHLKSKAFLNLSEELLKRNLIAPPNSFNGNR